MILCSRYDHRADIYSFGMTLLAIAMYDSGGLAACWSESPSKRFDMKRVALGSGCPIPASVAQTAGQWVRKIIAQCIAPNASMRPDSAMQVKERLLQQSPGRIFQRRTMTVKHSRGGGDSVEDLRNHLVKLTAQNMNLREKLSKTTIQQRQERRASNGPKLKPTRSTNAMRAMRKFSIFQ